MTSSDSASDHHANVNSNKTLGQSHDHPTTIMNYDHRSPFRRKVSFRRRRRLPAVRLGGKKSRRGFFLVRALRRVKMRSLKIKICIMLKKLKAYFRNLSKDIFEAGGTMDITHQRMVFETAFAIPVMGFAFNSLPLNYNHRA